MVYTPYTNTYNPFPLPTEQHSQVTQGTHALPIKKTMTQWEAFYCLLTFRVYIADWHNLRNDLKGLVSSHERAVPVNCHAQYQHCIHLQSLPMVYSMSKYDFISPHAPKSMALGERLRGHKHWPSIPRDFYSSISEQFGMDNQHLRKRGSSAEAVIKHGSLINVRSLAPLLAFNESVLCLSFRPCML